MPDYRPVSRERQAEVGSVTKSLGKADSPLGEFTHPFIGHT